MKDQSDVSRDSSIVVTQDDGEGKARQQLPDVELKEGVRRVFEDKKMSEFLFETMQDGKKLKTKWYEHPLLHLTISSVSVLATIVVLVKVYFLA